LRARNITRRLTTRRCQGDKSIPTTTHSLGRCHRSCRRTSMSSSPILMPAFRGSSTRFSDNCGLHTNEQLLKVVEESRAEMEAPNRHCHGDERHDQVSHGGKRRSAQRAVDGGREYPRRDHTAAPAGNASATLVRRPAGTKLFSAFLQPRRRASLGGQAIGK
jgi:hypothetical protein